MIKKLLCVTIATLFFCVCFCGCNKKSYNLTDSEVESGISAPKKNDERAHPAASEISGNYTLNGTDDSSDNTQWKAALSVSGDKFYLQVVTADKDIQKPDDATLLKLTSTYDEETGKYIQKYESDTYRSTYEAIFTKESDGRIKMGVYHRYLYTSDGETRSGLNASGYKTE